MERRGQRDTLPMPPAEPTPLARALGRIPSGLYLVTSLAEGQPLGFVASFVQQFGFEPPTVAVGVGRTRGALEAIRTSRHFAVNVLDGESKHLLPPFFGKVPQGEGPFDRLARSTPNGRCTVLDEALAWVECEVSGEHELADHVVVFGRCLAGGLWREGAPTVHLRRDGLGY
jgi:flavin reductase (DIM6/NTAB) family NADH-FMN oxidoreductase RutF